MQALIYAISNSIQFPVKCADQNRVLSTSVAKHAKPTKLFEASYSLTKLLGVGGFGSTYAGVRKHDGVAVAVKFIRREKISANRWAVDPDIGLIPVEALILKNIRHPNVVQFYELFKDDYYIILVQELFGTVWNSESVDIQRINHPSTRSITQKTCMDLYELRESRRLTSAEVKHIFKQLISTLEFLYLKHNVIHGDIKDENILVDSQMNIKLIDFGGAHRVQRGTLLARSMFHGTMEFAAPEVLKGFRFNPEQTEVWALGVLLYSLSFCEMPFKNAQQVLQTNFSDTPRASRDGSPVMELIKRCLVRDPRERIMLTDISSHHWFLVE